ncbi:DsbA family protein [Hyalangium versicolor]|uniref:DsbA family protein n=1 Tax=Hyalangium versicolor TaxID=2861190 RepID=UPI001CCFF1B2|nr:hypothetical protein [Hyalangium versicolor]
MKAAALGLVAWLFVGQAAWAEPSSKSTEFLNERTDDIVLGLPEAPVKLVAYVEYALIAKDTVAPLFQQIRRSWPNDVRIVVRDYPMTFHEGAALAAQAARGVFLLKGGEAYLRFVEEVTPYKGTRDAAYLSAAAERAGAGPAQRFEASLTQGKWKAGLEQSLADVAAVKMSGSPHWYLDGVDLKAGLLADKVLSAVEQAVKAAQERRNTPVPTLNPSKGIGPFFLGQTEAEVKRLGLRTGRRNNDWLCVAGEAGSDLCTYELRMKKGGVTRIDYVLSRSALGLQIGSEVFRRDRPALLEDLRARMGCGATEFGEGGSETPCPSPSKNVGIHLSQSMESACSDWARLDPSITCTGSDEQRLSTVVSVEKP